MLIISDCRRFVIRIEPRNIEADPPIVALVRVRPPGTKEVIESIGALDLIDLLAFNSSVATVLRQKGFVVRL